ncbi:MAG TPA: SRPBCC family protein [bacterium]|nr:SRPBCC family protein [bacterium]
MPIQLSYGADINAPADRVFQVMTDPHQFGRWMPNFVRAEDLTPGVSGTGQSWRETRKMFGKEASEVFEVRACDPPRSIELFCDGSKGTSGKGTYRFVYTLSPVGSGTRVACDGEISMGGGIAEFMGKLFSGSMKKMCEKDLQAMKQYIEGGQ